MVLDGRGRTEPAVVEIGASGSSKYRCDRVYESARTKVDEKRREELLLAAIETENARSYLVVRKLVRREEPRDEDFEEVKDVRKERGQSSDD